MNAEFAKDSAISSLHNQIQKFYDNNSAAHRKWGSQLKQMLSETSSGANIGGVEQLAGEIASLTKTASTPGGISLFSDAAKTEYKSTRELFSEVSKIYDDLYDKNQAQLLETLAGKRNGQAVAAILNNYGAVEDSLNSMANSAGNAQAEMNTAMDSIEVKLSQLKETGTGIAQNLFGREDMKTAIDGFTKLGEAVEWITSKLGMSGLLGLGAGLFAGIKNVGRDKMFSLLFI